MHRSTSLHRQLRCPGFLIEGLPSILRSQISQRRLPRAQSALEPKAKWCSGKNRKNSESTTIIGLRGKAKIASRNYDRSTLESDVRWYSENLSEDFYITALDGPLLDRDASLKRIANPYSGTAAEAEEVTLRILGDFAIVDSGFRGTVCVNRSTEHTIQNGKDEVYNDTSRIFSRLA